MIALAFDDLTPIDAILAVSMNLITYAVLLYATKLRRLGYQQWICRKLVHITLSLIIAGGINFFTSLTGPLITLILFLLILFGISIFKSDLVTLFLETGTRSGDSKVDTLVASISALIGYGLVVVFFINYPEIITSSILIVALGDGAGEVFGRPFGKHKIKLPWGNKSLEGSFAVFIMSFLSILMSLALFSNSKLNFPEITPLIFIVSAAVTLLEMIAYKWSDNLLLPIVSAYLLVYLLSIPP